MRTTLGIAVVLGLGAVALLGASGPARAADADRAKWAEHMGDVPFVIGFDKGMKEVEFTGRPPMLFFTMEG